MEIKLSKQCKSLTGSLGRGFGYHIQRRRDRFFAKRNTKGVIPPEGHLRFITTCAELAQNGLYIVDIRVSRAELCAALMEAGLGCPPLAAIPASTLNARDILNLKTTFSL